MGNEVNEPEPPSRAEEYQQRLLEGAGSLGPDNSHERIEFDGDWKVDLFYQPESPDGELVYPIEAYVCLKAYRRAVKDDKWQLEENVLSALTEQAREYTDDKSVESLKYKSAVLMNNMPIMIEPGHGMLSGDWRYGEEERLRITSTKVRSEQQQKILLGGLAAFMAFLARQDDSSEIN